MAIIKSSAPTVLGIFVTDPDTGQPVARLPLYAEVAVPRIVPVPPINERFREPVRAALLNTDPPAAEPPGRDRVEATALQAFAETFDEASRDRLLNEPERARELFEQAFRGVLEASGRESIANISPVNLKPLIVAAFRRVGPQMGLGLTPEVEDAGMIWQIHWAC